MVGFWATLAACDGPARPPSSEGAPAPVAAAPVAEVAAPAPAPAPAPAAVQEGEERRFTGVLRYTEIKPVKSVESYMGREFSLATTSDGPINIKASAAVSSEQLRALDGATITVRARFHPASQPSHYEQAPMEGDQPMARPAYYEVLELVSGP